MKRVQRDTTESLDASALKRGWQVQNNKQRISSQTVLAGDFTVLTTVDAKDHIGFLKSTKSVVNNQCQLFEF